MQSVLVRMRSGTDAGWMNPNTISFKGQVGLITGASGGLGLAYARLLASMGAHVVLHDVGAATDGNGQDPVAVAAAVEWLSANGLQAQGEHQPIDTRDACHALVERIVREHGRLDFLIHNAGWVEYQPIEALDEQHLDHMLAIAAKAPLWLAQAAWPVMRAAGGGRIVVTTSDRALYPQYVQQGLSSYAMGKSAAVGLVNVLAAEGAAHNIVVNAVSPVAKTRMWGITGEPDELHPEAVASGVAYLASRQCTEGGWILRASNGQFRATRLQETGGVSYPRDLCAVQADSPQAVHDAWSRIAVPSISEPGSRAAC